jgi:diacylglycerol kinase (ATP)
MKSLVIFNKFAAKSKAQKLLDPISEELADKAIKADIICSDSGESSQSYIEKCNLKEYDNIISVGGDGTLYHVINACMKKPASERIPVGQIPLGTGNAFCRDIGLVPNDFSRAIQTIKENKTRFIDTGKFLSGNETRYFSNIIGFGFVTDVAQTANKLKALGKISYTLGVLYHVAFLNPFRISVDYDGNRIEREIIFIEISNTRYTGSDFIMAPNAVMDDGLFDVTILTKTTRGKILRSLPKIFTGEHIHLDVIETFRASSLKIETEEPKLLTPDGELTGTTPINIECVPKSINFIVAG